MSVKRRGERWQARVDLGPDPRDGSRRQVAATFARQRDAERWEREQLAARDRGIFPTFDRTPLAAYLERWVVERPGVRASTRRIYRQAIRLWIAPHLGGVSLCDLKARDIHTLIHATLAQEGLAGGSRGQVLRILRAALKTAERLDLVPRNEASRVEMPAAEAPPPKHWSAAEVRAYLTCASRDHWWPLWLLAAHTGMRRGELAGLRWVDLDEPRGVIAVTQQIRYTPGEGRTEEPPKTKSSVRLVALSASCLAALRLHHATQRERARLLGALWIDCGLIFTTDTGRPLNPNRVTDRHAALCVAADLPPIRLHDMRHTASSLLHNAGVPLRVVADRLGHADVRMTDHYTHADLAGQQRAASVLDRLLADDAAEAM